MISVVMSIFNEKLNWIKAAVESILIQTYKDFEFIIVIDNPSIPDDIRSYIEEKREQDRRIIVLYNETNLGLALSLNRAISAAKGKYIARMDADDIANAERLQLEIEYIEKHQVDMVATNAIIVDENSQEIRKGISLPENPMSELEYTNIIIHPSVLMRKDAVCNLGGYRNFKRSQDYDLWLRLITAGYKIRIIDSYLMKYRVRTNSLTKAGRLEQYYTNLYQKKLHKERIRKGSDSFSENGLKKFLASKHIDQKKNQRCIKCMEKLDEAKLLMIQKKFKFVFLYLNAIVVFPSIAIRTLINFSSKKRKGRKP